VRLCLLCRYGQYPLHKAIDHACPESMNVIALLLELYPAAAKVADQDGYLPLHVCLDSRNPDEDLVEQLLIAFPDAAKRPTVDGLLPLHMAIGTNAQPSLGIIRLLMQIHPLACVNEVADFVPKDPNANASTWQGEWVETRWSPLNRAVERGLDDVVCIFRDILEEKGLLVVDEDTGEYFINFESVGRRSNSNFHAVSSAATNREDTGSAANEGNVEDNGDNEGDEYEEEYEETEMDGSYGTQESASSGMPPQASRAPPPPTWMPTARSRRVSGNTNSGSEPSATSPDQTPVRLRPLQNTANPRMVRTSPLYGGRLPHPDGGPPTPHSASANAVPPVAFEGNSLSSHIRAFRQRLFGDSTSSNNSNPGNPPWANKDGSKGGPGLHAMTLLRTNSMDPASEDSWEETQSVRTYSSVNSGSSMKSLMYQNDDDGSSVSSSRHSSSSNLFATGYFNNANVQEMLMLSGRPDGQGSSSSPAPGQSLSSYMNSMGKNGTPNGPLSNTKPPTWSASGSDKGIGPGRAPMSPVTPTAASSSKGKDTSSVVSPGTGVSSKSPSSLSRLIFKIPGFNKSPSTGGSSSGGNSGGKAGSGSSASGIATKPSRLSDLQSPAKTVSSTTPGRNSRNPSDERPSTEGNSRATSLGIGKGAKSPGTPGDSRTRSSSGDGNAGPSLASGSEEQV
jgi:hypothetical protein